MQIGKVVHREQQVELQHIQNTVIGLASLTRRDNVTVGGFVRPSFSDRSSGVGGLNPHSIHRQKLLVIYLSKGRCRDSPCAIGNRDILFPKETLSNTTCLANLRTFEFTKTGKSPIVHK